ncbi:MAG: FadR family transcriptional regulator [Desulfobacteraceae bacterium]|nr:FadR family transcriptional regulator [Desulfobacteraceae bacterium]
MESTTSQSLFRPAQIGRASEDVAVQIEAAIMSGQVRMGERLPSERNLQVLFSTSRGVIREALRALKQKGLIEVRKGAHGGAFVKTLEVLNASEPLALFLKQQQVSYENIIEFRESMDRTIALLAISRGEEKDKHCLLEQTVAFEKLINEPAPNMETVAEMLGQLNLIFVKMTKNPVFEMIMRTIQIGFSSQDQTLYEHAVYRFEAALNWRETARQIIACEALKTLSCISYHYALLQHCLAEKK